MDYLLKEFYKLASYHQEVFIEQERQEDDYKYCKCGKSSLSHYYDNQAIANEYSKISKIVIFVQKKLHKNPVKKLNIFYSTYSIIS